MSLSLISLLKILKKTRSTKLIVFPGRIFSALFRSSVSCCFVFLLLYPTCFRPGEADRPLLRRGPADVPRPPLPVAVYIIHPLFYPFLSVTVLSYPHWAVDENRCQNTYSLLSSTHSSLIYFTSPYNPGIILLTVIVIPHYHKYYSNHVLCSPHVAISKIRHSSFTQVI